MLGSIHVRCDTKESSLRCSSSSVILGFRLDSPCCSPILLTTCQHRIHGTFQPQSGSGAGCTESCWKQGFLVLVLISAFTIPMSEDEEVLEDFPMRDSISPVEHMVGAYRAEHTTDWSLIKWNYSKNSTLL